MKCDDMTVIDDLFDEYSDREGGSETIEFLDQIGIYNPLIMFQHAADRGPDVRQITLFHGKSDDLESAGYIMMAYLERGELRFRGFGPSEYSRMRNHFDNMGRDLQELQEGGLITAYGLIDPKDYPGYNRVPEKPPKKEQKTA